MGEPVSTRIVDRIAALEGADPVELRPPLYEVIDPEALDALFERPATRVRPESISLEFEYDGYRVSVGEGGGIAVDELDAGDSDAGTGEEPSPE